MTHEHDNDEHPEDIRAALDAIAQPYDPFDTTLPSALHDAVAQLLGNGVNIENIRIVPEGFARDPESVITSGVASAALGHEPNIECLWGHEESLRRYVSETDYASRVDALNEMGFNGPQFIQGVEDRLNNALAFLVNEDERDALALGFLTGVNWLAQMGIGAAADAVHAGHSHSDILDTLASVVGATGHQSAQEIIHRYYEPLGDPDAALKQLTEESTIDLRDQSPDDENGNSGS